MTALRSRVGFVLWPLAVAAVLGHLGLGVLAVVEYARLDWLVSVPYEFTAVTVVAGSGLLAVAGAVRVAWPAARGGRALRRLLRTAGGPLPTPVQAIAGSLGMADRVDLVATEEAFAVTHGLVRPRILPSYGWYLPLLRWWAQRLAVRRELAADRAATTSTGVAAVAGALLKLADLPTPAAVAAVNPAGNLPDRIAQLEGHPPVRRPRLGWLLAGATLANLGGLSAAAICCAGLGVAMAGGMT